MKKFLNVQPECNLKYYILHTFRVYSFVSLCEKNKAYYFIEFKSRLFLMHSKVF